VTTKTVARLGCNYPIRTTGGRRKVKWETWEPGYYDAGDKKISLI
jgi:hypothetical protein